MFDSSKVCCFMNKPEGKFIKSNRIQIKAYKMVLVKLYAMEKFILFSFINK